MSEENPQSLSTEELAEIDARYVPFPPFRDWPQASRRQEAWEAKKQEFEQISEGADEEDLLGAQRIAMRAAAFDTGAIEGLYATDRGLTFTVATQAAAWEQKVDEQGVDTRALFEAQLKAFELVLDHVTDRFPNVTQAWVRRLHEEITAPQGTYVVHTPVGAQEQPLPKGRYKEYPNHVRAGDGEFHAYAPVEATQPEMARLVGELETEEFQQAHPIIQASYAHYALVAIHPFADGNGRVARAVSSVYMYRAAGVPLLVLADRRRSYLAALAAADAGDASRFVGLIADVSADALELVADSLRTARSPQPEALLSQFDELHRVEARRREWEEVAGEFASWFVSVVKQKVDELDVPAGVGIDVVPLSRSRHAPPAGFKIPGSKGAKSVGLLFRSLPPIKADLVRRIDIYLSVELDDRNALLLQVAQNPGEQLGLEMAEIQPQLSGVAEHRIANFIRRVIGDGLKALHETAAKQLDAKS